MDHYETLKIVVYAKYTLFDSCDFGNWLVTGFLCIQCRWVNTYFNCAGSNITDTWINPKHIMIPSYKVSINQTGLQKLFL